MNTITEPWDEWNLKPYDPSENSSEPPVSLCVPPPAKKTHASVVGYGPVSGFAYCDKRMTYAHKRERSKFGKRSARMHTANCCNKAVIQILFDDGSVAVRCKAHTP